jgi:hypothetical protein
MRHSDLGAHNKFHLHELSWEDFRMTFEDHFVIDGYYHQSETVEYHRYMELKHLLHQEHARNSAFLFNRLELWLRRLLGKPFKPVSFYHQQLGQVQPHEVHIQRMAEPESWHKTFIISGTRKG